MNSDRKNRWAVATFFLVNGFILANWVARLPRIQEHYDLSNGTLGTVLLSASLGALFAMPLTGWLIVKQGSRRLTIIGGLFYVALVALIPVMPGLLLLYLVFFTMGIATGMVDVAMNAQAVVVEQAYQRPIMSSFHAVFSGGMMLGAGSGALNSRWQIEVFPHLLSMVILALILISIASFYLVKDAPEPEQKEAAKFQLPDSRIVIFGLIAFCCMLGEGAVAEWSTNFMEHVTTASEGFAPLGLAAFSMAMMVGRVFGDAIREKSGDGKLLLWSSMLAVLGLGVVVGYPDPYLSVGGFFIVGLGLASIVPIVYSRAGNLPNIEPGVGISMATTIGYAGFLFGPPMIGFMADWMGLRVALGGVLVLFVGMLGMSGRVS